MSKKQKTERKETQSPSKQEMQEALLRSGYLMEGRLVKMLDEMELFVEPNNSYLDEKTGISREVDLIAETGRIEMSREKTCVKTIFVIEAINNLYPVVLLTEQTWNPNTQQNCFPGVQNHFSHVQNRFPGVRNQFPRVRNRYGRRLSCQSGRL